MAQTISSLDLNAFSDLYSDSTQYFWFEGNASATYGAGVHITLSPDTSFISNPTGQNILMNTDGISIRNGLLPMMTLDNNSLDFNVVDTTEGTYITAASFSSTGSQIGMNNEARLNMDYRSLVLIDKSNAEFFNVSDLRNRNNEYDATDTFYGDGITQQFVLSFVATNTSYTVKVNGSVVTSEVDKGTTNIFFEYAPQNNSTIVVSYTTTSDKAKACTFGSRKSGGTIGGISCGIGYDVTAGGLYSYAEGKQTVSTGGASHAEGFETSATGSWGSHSEGWGTEARGDASHASGQGTVTASLAQTAIGMYNVIPAGRRSERNNSHPVFMIGNGTTDVDRSNALTVDWSGNLTLQNHSSSIGTIVKHEPSAVSCRTSYYRQLAYITLDSGIWIISGVGIFPYNNTTGVRRVYVSTATSSYDNVTTGPPAVGNMLYNQVPVTGSYQAYANVGSTPIEVTTTTTYRLIGFQNSGSSTAVNVTGILYAVRIV